MLTPFLPEPGINSDDTSFSATGRWADGNNVRFVDGHPQVIGEFRKVFETALTGTVRNIFPFTRGGAVSVAYGTSSRLYVGAGVTAPDNESPVGLGTSITSWSFGAWGSTLLASPGGGGLYEQSGTSTATEVTQAPDVMTSMLVTPQRQVLALGCNEEGSGAFNGLCIRGSNLEDYSDWTTTSSNNAFEHILDGAGVIVGARMVGDYVAVWTDTSLYLGQFIGDPGQTYRFDRVAGGCGLIGPRAVTLLNETVYWLGSDLHLRAWVPGTLPAVLPCTVSRKFEKNLDGTMPVVRARMIVAAVPRFGEVWITYPNAAVGGFIAVNAANGAWFKGDLIIDALSSNDLFRSADSGGNTDTNLWGASGTGVYAYECARDISQAGPTSWYLESADHYFDDAQRRMMLRGIVPDFKDAAADTNTLDVTLTIRVRDRPQSAAVTKGPYAIAAGATKKDFRASGKIVSVKLSQSTNVDRELRVGKILFDVVPMGER